MAGFGVAEGDEEAAIGRVETEEEAALSVGDEEVGEGFAELECGFDGGADGGGGGEEFGDGAADSFGLGPLEEALGGTVGDEQFWTAIEEENDVLHAFEELFDVSLHGDDVLAGAAELLVEDVEFGLEGGDFGGGPLRGSAENSPAAMRSRRKSRIWAISKGRVPGRRRRFVRWRGGD